MGLITLYDIAWHSVLPLLSLSPRLKQGWHQRTGQDLCPQRVDVWLQAASVGESFMALEICRRLFDKGVKNILVTSNTVQGLSVLDKEPRVYSRFFPFDMPRLMARCLSQWHPKVVVLLETELWPGLLNACKDSATPLLLVNGRVSPASLRRYLMLKALWQDVVPKKIMAVSEEDASRFREIFPAASIGLMNNIKFDTLRLKAISETYGRWLTKIVSTQYPFVVLGSVRKQEEADVLRLVKFLMQKRQDIVIGLFPRHMHRIRYWQKALRKNHVRVVLRSEANGKIPGGTVILWDRIGELRDAYSLAAAAFVGGSLRPCGGQNFLEPLAFGVVPCIGPYWDNFKWIGQDILKTGLAVQVKDWEELGRKILEGISAPRRPDEVIDRVKAYIEKRKGGTEMACIEILKYL